MSIPPKPDSTRNIFHSRIKTSFRRGSPQTALPIRQCSPASRGRHQRQNGDKSWRETWRGRQNSRCAPPFYLIATSAGSDLGGKVFQSRSRCFSWRRARANQSPHAIAPARSQKPFLWDCWWSRRLKRQGSLPIRMPTEVDGAVEHRIRTLGGVPLQAHDPIHSRQLEHPAFIWLNALTSSDVLHMNKLA